MSVRKIKLYYPLEHRRSGDEPDPMDNARTRGWSSNSMAYTINFNHARGGFSWNQREKDDLAWALSNSVKWGDICAIHGRSMNSITAMAERLGFHAPPSPYRASRESLLPPDINALFNCRCLLAPPINWTDNPFEKKETPMKMNPRMAMLLLKLLQGPIASPSIGRTPDFTWLHSAGLVRLDGVGSAHITEHGREVASAMLVFATGLMNHSVETEARFDPGKNGFMMKADVPFYMIARGLAQAAPVARHVTKPVLVTPSRVVHDDFDEAVQEAERLAEAQPDEPFFILRAVSSRRVPSRRIETKVF